MKKHFYESQLKQLQQTFTTRNKNDDLNNIDYKDKQTMLIEALQQGQVESFSHLFHFFYREPILIDAIADKYFAIPLDHCDRLKTQFVLLEEAKRKGNFNQVYDLVQEISTYFENEKDTETSDYLYYKMIEFAQQSGNVSLQCKALHYYGIFLQRISKWSQSLHFLRECVILAKANQIPYHSFQIDLIKMYIKMGEITLQEKDYKNSCHYFEEAFALFQDETFEALELYGSCALFGSKLFNSMQDFNKALDLEQIHLDVSRKLGDVKETQKASIQLSTIYESLGMNEKAITLLQTLLEDDITEMDTSLLLLLNEKMGMLLVKLHRYEQAIPFFEKNYQFALQSNHTQTITDCKMKIGMCKANLQLLQKQQQ